MKGKFVLVTTEARGVFAGTLVTDPSPAALTLTSARMCIRWTTGAGVLGLAQAGPSETCTLSAAAPELTLYGITGIALCTSEAEAAWQR